MISFDDYHEDNMKLAKLIKKYKLEKETIFFIECIGSKAQEQIIELSKMKFQIGSHTMTHSHLNTLHYRDIEWELNASKKIIEQLTNKKCEWFCYPRGRYNQDIIDMVEQAGYKYARTTKFKDGSTDFEIGGIHLTYPRKEYAGIDPFDVAKDSRSDHYWGHVFEIEKFNLWDKMEKFLRWYNENLRIRKQSR